ncbi:hypothetical protein MATL_G00173400 [Megalops atlanticus]|uniref:Uncharacterized protein n=1 Tax=Megalops atlanticus TaxID=7932 RepID=A0A9D3T8B9_MEGAT|nr:hypothetical protein MATL_G00173400 [Megalops atlanticus]
MHRRLLDRGLRRLGREPLNDGNEPHSVRQFPSLPTRALLNAEDNTDCVADMRPRSRLLAKKRLPTIREGYEELLQDMNQANSYHAPCHAHHDVLSSEDYLRSICQLARPTFPLQEPDSDILTLGQLEALKPSLRLPRISTPARPLTPTARSCGRREEQQRRDKPGCSVLSHIVALPDGVTPHLGKDGCHGAPDPLEYLYGHRSGPASSTCLGQDAKGRLGQGEVPGEGGARPGSRPLPRAHSFPRLCSPRHTWRKSSCPEISLEDSPSAPPLPPRLCQPALPTQRGEAQFQQTALPEDPGQGWRRPLWTEGEVRRLHRQALHDLQLDSRLSQRLERDQDPGLHATHYC